MSNPNVQRNVVMTISTKIDPDANRYLRIPYFPKALDAFTPPYLGLFEWHCLQIDRKGIFYNLGIYFTIINAIQAPKWFHGGELFSNLAIMCAIIAQIASYIAVSSIIGQWMKTQDLSKLEFL